MQLGYLYKKIITIFLLSFFTLWADKIPEFKTSIDVKTIFGNLKLQDELLKIYNLESMQRLKGVDCSGSLACWNHVAKFNRLDHSLEILWLVQNFGGDLQEQIAALTHDISYTVFSQVVDIFFGEANYQETHHQEFLKGTKIAGIICGHDWVEKDIVPENPDFKRLKQTLPNMCAENIAYNLHLGLTFNKITQEDIKLIISKLRYEDGKWLFTSKAAAKKFAKLALDLTEYFWGAADNLVAYHITGKILERARLLQRITKDDMHICNDQQILDKLNECDDPKLNRLIAKVKFPKKTYRLLQDGEGTPDFVPKPKFLGVDPWVFFVHSKKTKRLSEIDKRFAAKFKQVKDFCEIGYKIQLNLD